MSKELVFTDIFEFIKLINSEKHIFFPKRFSPCARIASEILEFKSRKIVTIKKEKFMQSPKKTAFIKKLNGFSTF